MVACFLQVAASSYYTTAHYIVRFKASSPPPPLLIGCVHPQGRNYNDADLHAQQSLQKKPPRVESPCLEYEFEI